MDSRAVPVVQWDASDVAIEPPEPVPGAWVGAPSALLVDGTYWLAYRVRLPLGAGRGVSNVVARSSDGVHFETVAVVEKEEFGAESLERPALVHTPEGRWRLYVSCATPDTKHWRIAVIEADEPAGLSTASARTVLPGDGNHAVKDPVIVVDNAGLWHLYASVHPLDLAGEEDRMTTEHYVSPDGLDWEHAGRALDRSSQAWDSRGVRITAVLPGERPLAWYDGRASAGENWEERTGLAVGDDLGSFTRVSADPVAQSPYAPYGLRYLSLLAVPDSGLYRIYYEGTRADGSHELRTQLAGAGR